MLVLLASLPTVCLPYAPLQPGLMTCILLSVQLRFKPKPALRDLLAWETHAVDGISTVPI